MAEAGRNVSGKWVKRLEQEAALWQQEGIIDQNQSRAILDRYRGLPEEGENYRSGRLVTVLAVLGSLLLGTGIIIFFASNWQAMSKGLKVGIVFGSIISTYAAGYYLAYEKQNYPRVGRALIFLGSILYGAGIWLIAQIFHISAHFPNGFLLWAAGIIPVALICGSVSVLTQSTLLLTVWTFLEHTAFAQTNYWYLPPAALVLMIAYRLKSGLVAGLTLPGLALWAATGDVPSVNEGHALVQVLLMTSLIGLLLLSLSFLQKHLTSFSYMAVPYQVSGLLIFFISLFILSFKEVVRTGIQGMGGSLFYGVAAGLVLVAVLSTAGYVLLKGLGPRQSSRAQVYIIAGTVLLAALLANAFIAGVTVQTALINLVLFAAVIGTVILGYSNREPVLINVGLVFFVLDIIARYFDFFWDMLDKSVFFIAGGLLLLVGGTLLERNRRKIVREMQVNSHVA